MPVSRGACAVPGTPTPRELVEPLDRMDPADVAAWNIDMDAIGRVSDPRQLRGNGPPALSAATGGQAGLLTLPRG